MARPPARLGTGVLWRPENAVVVETEVASGRVSFIEVIAESMGAGLPPRLDACRRAGAVVVPHGVGLGIGGAERPDRRRLAALAEAVEVCGAPVVSEHVAFVRSGGIEAGHLLPVPRTREALDVLVANVRAAEATLPVPLALEPIASLTDWPNAELAEAAVLVELLERTGVGLVLDLANLHVNAANRRLAGVTGPDADAGALLDALPTERIAYVHVAGGTVRDGRYHDTHEHGLWPEVAAMVEELWARCEPPGILLERESRVPGDELRRELDALTEAAARGRARRIERAVDPRSMPMPSPGPTQLSASMPTLGPTPQPMPVQQVRWLGFRQAQTPAPAARRLLGEAQVQLLRAVCAGGPTPSGFAADELDAVADVLARKRAAAVMRAVPEVAVTPVFQRQFLRWARRHPIAAVDGRSDARSFFRSLAVADRASGPALAVVAADLRRRARRRRPFGFAVRRVHRGLVCGVRVGPWVAVTALGGGHPDGRIDDPAGRRSRLFG